MPVTIRLKRTGAESCQRGDRCLLSGVEKGGNGAGERKEEGASQRTGIQAGEQMGWKLKATRRRVCEQLKVTGTSSEYVHI